MLSNQSSELRSGHQRQKSTPLDCGAGARAPYIPITYSSQQQSHRRGLSLDHSMFAHEIMTATSPGSGVVSTNQGLYEQQHMRETQMQGPTRPGHQSITSEHELEDIFTPQLVNGDDFSKANHDIERSFREFEQLGFDLNSECSTELYLNTGTGTDLGELEHQHNTSSSYHPPQTPRKQTVRDIYPLTPASRYPHINRTEDIQSSPIHERQFNLSHIPEASPMKRGSSCQESSTMKPSQSTGESIPSPPHTAPLKCSATFDIAPIPSAELLDIATLNLDFTSRAIGYSSSNYSPMTNRASPTLSSQKSSPELAPVSLFGEISNGVPQFPSQNPGATSPKKGRASSPRKKAQEITEDMIVEDTGITIEQVDAFIQGPDPETNAYTCLYEDCKCKPILRKENIRSHVQTHLGDRKYVCAVCNNRFVRPNDLKRHATTHQVSKDYVCRCGAAFGRQDALRRHKQRKSYCLDGDPTLELKMREEKKRGRPRKIAPMETNERRERKENIRKQVMAKKRNGSVATSVATSHSSPPTDYYSPEQMDHHSPPFLEYSPGQMSLTPPASPQHTATSTFSPFHSQHSQTPKANNTSPPPSRGSMTASDEQYEIPGSGISPFNINPLEPIEPSLPNNESTTKSTSSQYGTPPELEISSSSPASRFLDLDISANTNQNSQITQGIEDLFDLGGQDSLEDMYPLFGEDTIMTSIQKMGRGPNDLGLDFDDVFDWGLV